MSLGRRFVGLSGLLSGCREKRLPVCCFSLAVLGVNWRSVCFSRAPSIGSRVLCDCWSPPSAVYEARATLPPRIPHACRAALNWVSGKVVLASGRRYAGVRVCRHCHHTASKVSRHLMQLLTDWLRTQRRRRPSGTSAQALASCSRMPTSRLSLAQPICHVLGRKSHRVFSHRSPLRVCGLHRLRPQQAGLARRRCASAPRPMRTRRGCRSPKSKPSPSHPPPHLA